MGSRREEERNEKIIRGLMKLPPNRRCINCDSQGPQYVCTNFWTFICVTCSGIHREFTHRVKSVSMSKFSSQEVDALQRGGNQRAREIFLKSWDMQSHKLPTSSNVDRIREFIKSVYVDKKYAGGPSSDKPPRDLQSPKIDEEEHRRASSYHSFSQSPPYDHQYEDRLYGKQNHMLTRKPGSERALHDGKFASFLYSPHRKREEMQEDGFTNEGSAPRFSDFSVSSSGEAFGSGVQSPNFQRDIGITEPPSKPIREILIEDAQTQKLGSHTDAAKIDSDGFIPQSRTGINSGSSDGKTFPVNSATSINLFEDVPDTLNPDGAQPAKMSAMPSQLSAAVHALDEDLFGGAVKPPSAEVSAQIVDLFAGFDSSTLPSASSAEVVDFFADNFDQTSSMPSQSQKTVSAENEDWAHFDIPQFPVSQTIEKSKAFSTAPSIDGTLVGNFLPNLPSNNGSQLPSEQSVFLNSRYHTSTQINDMNTQTLPALQPWDAFGNSFGNPTQPPSDGLSLKDEVNISHTLPPNVTSYIGLDFFENSSQIGQSANRNLHTSVDSLHQASSLSANFLGGSAIQEKKSVNPFESDLQPSNLFMNMSSLQATLSTAQAPEPFLSNAGLSWLPQDHLLPYMNHIPPGYIPGSSPSSQLGDLPFHGSGAALGGNPFAPQQPSPSLANLSVQGAGPSLSGNPFV